MPGWVADASAVEFLSEHLELFFARGQAWGGELGFNTAAHELHKTGEILRIGSQIYTSGLAHHANGRIAVLLGGDYERFEAGRVAAMRFGSGVLPPSHVPTVPRSSSGGQAEEMHQVLNRT